MPYYPLFDFVYLVVPDPMGTFLDSPQQGLPVQRLTVWIYKGSRRAETYLYVPGEDDFQRVPEDLLTALGTLELVMQIELDEQRRLARVPAKEVMKGISQAGYFLQLAPIEPKDKRLLQ